MTPDDEETGKPIGSIIDGLGVTASLDPSQHITEVIVLAKITDFEDGGTSVGVYKSDDMDWVSQLGLFRVATLMMETTYFSHTEED